MRKAVVMFAVLMTVGLLMAELGSGNPTDAQLIAIRLTEVGGVTPVNPSGIFDIPVPPAGTQFRPAQRVPRDKFGEVGPFPLQLSDLNALVYPDTTLAERQQMLEGMSLFTLAHTAAEGAGPMANQPFCLGCHQSSAESLPHEGLVSGGECAVAGSTCTSIVSREPRRPTLSSLHLIHLRVEVLHRAETFLQQGVAPQPAVPIPTLAWTPLTARARTRRSRFSATLTPLTTIQLLALAFRIRSTDPRTTS